MSKPSKPHKVTCFTCDPLNYIQVNFAYVCACCKKLVKPKKNKK